MHEPPILVCDFDGTITSVDVGDALCDRFAPPEWLEIDERWLRGEIALPDAQQQMWALVRASEADLVAHALSVGTLRPGADELLAAAEEGLIELVIASAGFELYIEALLGSRRAAVRELVANGLRSRAGGGYEPVFRPGAGCPRCGQAGVPAGAHSPIYDGVCKARVIRRFLAPGRRVAFCGDGSSDRCAASVAPELFVVPGGALMRHCNDMGINHVCAEDLDVVVRALCNG